MKPIDTHYLYLQFWDRVHRKNAMEFQSFFEGIMQKAYPDFQKIKPYGNQGDAGNDGYRPTMGAYYQAYAPSRPTEKESFAARKLRDDFEKLKKTWDKISEIKSYHFVFNDKGGGSTIELERALSELRSENQGIEFEIFTPDELKRVFFKLNNSDLLALGFNVDARTSLGFVNEYLTKIEIDLDRELGNVALRALAKFEEILKDLQNEALQLRFEILEAKALQLTENAVRAREKCTSLCKRFLDDPRPSLQLAEYHLIHGNFDGCDECLKTAETIDRSHWLLTLMKLVRDLRLGVKIDTSEIDVSSFPIDPRTKSSYYRLYALFLSLSGDFTRAESFIERAICLNPDRLQNYGAKLSILKQRLFAQRGQEDAFQQGLTEYLTEINVIEQKVMGWGDISPRTQAMINFEKMFVALEQEDLYEVEELAKPSFEILMKCSFDLGIDSSMVWLLQFTVLPPDALAELLRYLQRAVTKKMSAPLAKALAFQFLLKGNLIDKGKGFFEAAEQTEMLQFIDTIENENYEDTWSLLKDDLEFAVAVAQAAKNYPYLRRFVIRNLPDDGKIQKDKLLLLLMYDEKDYRNAFELLKSLDISDLNYIECKPYLDIAKANKAWDFEIVVLEKLLEHEMDTKTILQLKLQLFDANFKLGRFPNAISIGESILLSSDDMALLDDSNQESLLAQTIIARLNRGENSAALCLLEKFSHFARTYEFKIEIETNVYLKNGNAEKALSSIVEAIKLLKTPNPEQYGSLFFQFTVIGNMIDLDATPLDRIIDNSFVKIANQQRWYYVGDSDELDATKIAPDDDKYSLFIGRKIGDNFVLESRYSSERNEYTVENILAIDKYILGQCWYYAQKLTQEHRWDKMEAIEVSTEGDEIDMTYLIKRMEDDKKKRGDFFDLYCKKNVPLAFLAVNVGGLQSAIATIVNEDRGFINFSLGTTVEMNKQQEIARSIISGAPFYIDGTSALMLSETELLEATYKYMPNLKVPQSVITMLHETRGRFVSSPGQFGHMGYAQGRLTFSKLDQEKSKLIQSNLDKCVKLLESKPQNIVAISSATKSDVLAGKEVPAELCDACFLAQRDNVPILTEDFLYLRANELLNKKQAPEYCSTFALIRTLYEEKQIAFDQYLGYFRYLSSYRFRFLPISTDDIEKAVFGDGAIMTIEPEGIRYFNFPLTLSQEYGVPFDDAFLVVRGLLIRVLIDDTITSHKSVRIFDEILSAFPSDKDKGALGKMFLRAAAQFIYTVDNRIIIGSRTQEKIELLSRFATTHDRRIITRS